MSKELTLSELEAIYKTKGVIALNKTMDIALDKLHDYIQEEVYKSYDPIWYDRTFELLNNWEYTAPIIKGKWIESELSFSIPITYSGTPNWQHGMSEVDNDSFTEIINEGKIGDICGFPQLGARPFWQKFENWVHTDLEEIFKQQCILIGLPITTQFSYTI